MPVNVNLSEELTTAAEPSDTGKLFALGLLQRGSTSEAITVHTNREFEKKTGGALEGSLLAEGGVAGFLGEGGATLILGRIVGETPVIAKLSLKTSGETISLEVEAVSVGEWGNELKVQVKDGEAGSTYRLVVEEKDEAVEESPDLLTQTAAVSWAEDSDYIRVKVGAGDGNPAVAAAKALTGGTADLAKITTACYEAALGVFTSEEGCGQVAAPGITSSAVQELLETHGEENNRTPLLDLVNSEEASDLISAASSLRTAKGAKRTGAFSTWAVIPGATPRLPNRIVPWSVIQAGIFARNDAASTPPAINQAAAGEAGQPRYAIGITAQFNREDRESLLEAGINPVRIMPVTGAIQVDGDRTLGKPEDAPAWEQLSAARTFMYVWAKGEEILERFKYKEIDRNGLLFQKVGAELLTMLEGISSQLYNNVNEAVDVGSTVNTEETIAKKELVAAIAVQPNENVEVETLNITAQGV